MELEKTEKKATELTQNEKNFRSYLRLYHPRLLIDIELKEEWD